MEQAAQITKQQPHLAWPVDRVKDLTSKIGSGVTPKGGASSYVDSGIPLLRSQNIHFDGLHLDDVAFITKQVHSEMAGTCVRAHDVLLNITGASIGRCTYVPETLGEANVNQHVCIIRPLARINHKFLTYFLSSPWGQDQILSSFTGASRQGLASKELGAIQVPTPPVPQQEIIVKYLDRTCAAVDAAISVKRSQIEALEVLRRNQIESAVIFGIRPNPALRHAGEDWVERIPAHWGTCRVKRVLSRVDYGISETTELEGRFPVLKMGQIQDGGVNFSEVEFVNEVPDALLLEHGDLLYNRTNSPDQVAKAAVFRGQKKDCVTFASYLVRLRANHRADPFFLNYVLNSGGFLTFARKLAIPSVQQSNLNSTRYCRIFIPLPPIPEQREIVAHLDQKSIELNEIVSGINEQIEALLGYRNSLVHECVTGQRSLTEADLMVAPIHAHA